MNKTFGKVFYTKAFMLKLHCQAVLDWYCQNNVSTLNPSTGDTIYFKKWGRGYRAYSLL